MNISERTLCVLSFGSYTKCAKVQPCVKFNINYDSTRRLKFCYMCHKRWVAAKDYGVVKTETTICSIIRFTV